MNLPGIFGEILGAVFGLYVANSIPAWHIPVIVLDKYLIYLPYANMAIVGTCVTRVLMHIFPWYRAKMLFEALSELIGIFSLYMLITIFPLDFTPLNRIEINTLLRFAFIIAIIGVSIAFLTTCVRAIRGKP